MILTPRLFKAGWHEVTGRFVWIKKILKNYSKKLRKNLTPAEATLWKLLQRKQLLGRKFRRQHCIGDYILDFYCPQEKLAIELDGDVHFNDQAWVRDVFRDSVLMAQGIKVIRFENKQVFNDPDAVLEIIRSNFK